MPPWLAAFLAVALLCTGVLRGAAMASDGPEIMPSIPGVMAHVCHTEGKSDPGTPRRDCCDGCALCASAALPAASALTAAEHVVFYSTHDVAVRWAPAVVRQHTPRLAQGPPAA